MNSQATNSYESDCDQALGWITRFRADNVSDEDRQNFALWLSGAPARRRAMDEMLELWDDLGAVEALPFPATDTHTAANQSRWLGVAAAAACVVAALALWPFQTSTPVNTYPLQTALGEQRTFDLTDGSRVTLNTDSELTVAFTDDERHIELHSGEAFFQVTPDKHRPFTVEAGMAEATVVGTAFNVYRQDQSTSITVTEGVVRVTEIIAGDAQRAVSNLVQANQHVIATSAGLEANSEVDTRPLLAWRQWELVANDMRLYDLAMELERYDERRILFGDRSIASMRVSGVFPLDQPDALLQAVSRALNLQVVELDRNAVQLLKAPD